MFIIRILWPKTRREEQEEEEEDGERPVNNWPIWSDEVQPRAHTHTHFSHILFAMPWGSEKYLKYSEDTRSAQQFSQATQDEQHVEQTEWGWKKKENK